MGRAGDQAGTAPSRSPHPTWTVRPGKVLGAARQPHDRDSDATGITVGPALARRLLCDVIPAVLGATGEPLHIGRATRAWPTGLRRAITQREGDWQLRMGADGHPEFIPPTWLDPDQHPRRNTLHRLRQ